jgi:excisionase family DNA binding protein
VARKPPGGFSPMPGRHSSNLPDVLSVDQTAKYLGIGRNTAYEAIRLGEIPSFSVGRRKLVLKQALLAKMNG